MERIQRNLAGLEFIRRPVRFHSALSQKTSSASWDAIAESSVVM